MADLFTGIARLVSDSVSDQFDPFIRSYHFGLRFGRFIRVFYGAGRCVFFWT